MLDNVGANLCRKILTMITVLLKFQLKKCQLQCQSKKVSAILHRQVGT